MLPADHAALSIVSILNSDSYECCRWSPLCKWFIWPSKAIFVAYVDDPPTKYNRMWSPQMDCSWPCHKWSPVFFTHTAINGSKLCMEANYMCRANVCSLHACMVPHTCNWFGGQPIAATLGSMGLILGGSSMAWQANPIWFLVINNSLTCHYCST